jgi:hypothetical protein
VVCSSEKTADAREEASVFHFLVEVLEIFNALFHIEVLQFLNCVVFGKICSRMPKRWQLACVKTVDYLLYRVNSRIKALLYIFLLFGDVEL